jgi:carbamoyl-phosphate synthase large subunit
MQKVPYYTTLAGAAAVAEAIAALKAGSLEVAPLPGIFWLRRPPHKPAH